MATEYRTTSGRNARWEESGKHQCRCRCLSFFLKDPEAAPAVVRRDEEMKEVPGRTWKRNGVRNVTQVACTVDSLFNVVFGEYIFDTLNNEIC